MRDRPGQPRISVVVPTYNRADLVAKLLRLLLRQSVPADQIEVVVADDGSSDHTKAVVDSFAGRLRVAYHYQQDRGMRVARARNAGARLATAPVLLFVDTGALPGPHLLRSHLAAHAGGSPRRAVVGYAWGYDPRFPPVPGLAETLETLPPEQALARFAGDPQFRDVRHEALAACDFALERMPLPWRCFFTLNCSVRADDFWAVGGFDERFVEWGAEDLELGYRLHRHGLSFHSSRDAWTIEWPHQRDMASRWSELIVNMARFLEKFPEPAVELGCVLAELNEYWRWESSYRELQEWTRQVEGVAVTAEIAEAVRDAGPGERVAVFGAGGVPPAGLPPAVLIDFDRGCVDRAANDGRHTGHHAIGIRTVLPDRAVDRVVITSRLAGLWESWGEALLAEARRIAGGGGENVVITDRQARVP